MGKKIALDRQWWLYVLLGLLIAAVIFVCCWCFSVIANMHEDFRVLLDSSKPLVDGQNEGRVLKDSASGVAMVYVGIITALVTFIAFLVPLSFNIHQHRRHTDNRSDIAQERFENKFFFYLESYANVVNNIEIINICKGHHSFNYIFYELQTLFYILNDMRIESLKGGLLTDAELIDIAVSISVNGLTTNSRGDEYDIIYHKYTDLLSQESYLRIVKEISSYKNMDDTKLKQMLKGNRYTFFANFARFQLEENRKVYWFRGKRSELIPYFKLIQTAFDFIDRRYPAGSKGSNDEKFYYLDLLNSHMSDHELALLHCLVNSHENTLDMKKDYVEYMVEKTGMPSLYNFKFWNSFNPNK